MPFDGALSPLHWLIVATVALLVLGPDQLPRAGREAAKAFRLVRDARTAITGELATLLGGGPADEPDEDLGFGAAPPPPTHTPDDAAPDTPIPWRAVSR
jgi:Sec-independent protein translocase protein TatA